MTRCKPHVGYFEEILRRLALRAQDCLMVGDNPRKDLPAAKVGIRTFLLGRGRGYDMLDGWLAAGGAA